MRKMVRTLWHQRKLIIAIGIAGGALGLALSFSATKYVSSGLFQVPAERTERNANAAKPDDFESVSTANYKRYENVLLNPRNLESFLERHTQPDEPGVADLLKLASHPNELRTTITPEFSLTEKEQRTFGIKLSSEDGSALLGFRVRHASKEPTRGAPLKLIGEYLRDSVIMLDLRDRFENQCKRHELRAAELRNEQLKAQFAIEQEEERMKNLRRLITKNPTAAAADTRQIISLENNGARFLPPGTHLNAAEIALTDIRLGEKARERESIASAIKKSYYCEAVKLLEKPSAAATLLDQLGPLQLAAIKSQNPSLDIVEQTHNELQLELNTWRDNYLRIMRYVAAPETLEIKERNPGPVLGLLGGGLLGGFLGMMVALLWSWWQNNRDDILTDAEPN